MGASSRREFLRESAAATAAAVTVGASIGGVALGSAARPLLARAAAVDQAVAASEQATAPPLRVHHDLHTHTVHSDGAHPIPLHILEGRAFELEAMAITDHYTPGSELAGSEAALVRYIEEIERERSAQDDLVVLVGAEATALDTTGKISIGERQAGLLEWVLCDLGGQSEGTLRRPPSDKGKLVDNVVRTYLGLCDVKYLDAIAHPFNTGNVEPAALPADYPPHLLRELAGKMAANGKVFDVMNDMIYWFHEAPIAPRELTAQYVELVKVFAAEGVQFQVSSDDHRTGLGNTRWSQIVLGRAGVKAAQIVDPLRIASRKK
jgi:histidinol phosphatase-like PHP family hydrolase